VTRVQSASHRRQADATQNSVCVAILIQRNLFLDRMNSSSNYRELKSCVLKSATNAVKLLL
jgi:hypothetical protein